MLRPASIVTFERCYLGAWLLGLLNLAITWNARLAMASAALSARGGLTAPGMPDFAVIGIVVGLVVGAAITFVLWWFVARQESVVAKWIVVVFFALGIIGLLSSVQKGTFVGGAGGVLTVVQWVLQTVAVVMLFRPDAIAWFARHRDDGVAR